MTQTKSETKRSNKWRLVLTSITLLALVLLIYFLRDQIMDTISNFHKVNLYILSLVLVWRLLNYHSYAKLYQELFDILGHKISYTPLLKVSIELNFVSLVFPSGGLSGFSYFGLRMKQLGTSIAQATLVQTMRFITIFISFQVLLFFGLIALAIGGKASNLTILVAGSLATLLGVGTLLVIYIVGDRKRIDSFFTAFTKFLNGVIRLVRPRHPETINIKSARKLFLEFHENYVILRKNYRKLKEPLFYAFLASFTEIATIYTIYAAFGDYVNMGGVILAYAIANFAGLISVLPGGIGVYEALMTAVMAAVGVPASRSIPITVMYRVLSTAIQLPPGYYLYHKALHKKEKPLV